MTGAVAFLAGGCLAALAFGLAVRHFMRVDSISEDDQ